MAESRALLDRPAPALGAVEAGAQPPAVAPPPAGTHDGAATLALVALTLAAAAGFARVFADSRWVGPVVITALGVHAVCWLTRRGGLHPVPAAIIGLGAVGLLTIWTVLPSTTTLGLPLGASWRIAGSALSQARADFPATVAPVTSSTGFVLLAVWGTGVVALLGDWVAMRLRAPLQGSVPALSLFVICGVVGVARGRAWAAGLIVAATLLHLVVHRATVGTSAAVWFGGRSAGAAAWATGVGALATAAAVTAVLVAIPALPRSNGHGALGWRGEGPGAGGSSRSVPSPIVDLRTRLLEESDTPVFVVRSTEPSYWRLTSLDTFTGIQWQSTNSYVGVSHQLPGVQAAQPGTRTVTEDFTIQSLSSIWMPTAFTPEQITGDAQVSWDPTSGSLLASQATSDNLRYELTSLQYLNTVTAASLSAAPQPATSTFTKRYTALPASIPQSVYDLARRITLGAPNEYAKALALQNYFIDSPDFTYSLEPPSDGYGTDALTTFLFTTKTGYCQQFAGAYAVLARAIGLPTRLAVGFAEGTPAGNDTYQVRDRDAHTWPEVWFGPTIGWLPFEPTKGAPSAGFAIPGATGYTGDTAHPATPSAPSSPVIQPASPLSPTPRQSAPAPGHATSPASPAPVARVHHGSTPLLPVAAGVAATLLVWVGITMGARRVRWWRRRRSASADPRPGAAAVLVAWEEVCELLGWWRVRRRADETPTEFAGRATRMLHIGLGDGGALGRLPALAAAVTAAGYSDGPLSPAQVDRALDDGRQLRALLWSSAATRRRLQVRIDPRLAWRPAAVDSAPPLRDTTSGYDAFSWGR